MSNMYEYVRTVWVSETCHTHMNEGGMSHMWMREACHTCCLKEYVNTVVVIIEDASRDVTLMNIYATCEWSGMSHIFPGGVLEYSGGDYWRRVTRCHTYEHVCNVWIMRHVTHITWTSTWIHWWGFLTLHHAMSHMWICMRRVNDEACRTYYLEEYLNTVVVLSDVASRNVTHMNMYVTCEWVRCFTHITCRSTWIQWWWLVTLRHAMSHMWICMWHVNEWDISHISPGGVLEYSGGD